ncbi:MAG: response regulator transcription factor [Raoultibacter sp.]
MTFRDFLSYNEFVFSPFEEGNSMKVLVVEDNAAINCRVVEGFREAGFLVESCFTGEDGLVRAIDPSQGYDLAIIDIMLPVVDGLAIIKAMRAKNISTPVIMLTALTAVEDRVGGLDAGADDYVGKPFALDELLARARALLRRPHEVRDDSCIFGDLVLDAAARTLSVGDAVVALSKREAALLEALMRQEGRPLSRERILMKVWGADHPVEAGNVDNYIYFLRRKLSASGSSMEIASARGLGYYLGAACETA